MNFLAIGDGRREREREKEKGDSFNRYNKRLENIAKRKKNNKEKDKKKQEHINQPE